MPKTLFEKLWNLHRIKDFGDGESLVFIDRIFLHERTGSIALKSLEESGRPVKTPHRVFCTMDHIVDTFPGRSDKTLMPSGQEFIRATRDSANAARIALFDLDHPQQGIAHVLSPELGIALPGATLVCPDSHTCTLGGIGALAWGIGSTEAEHALATDTLRVKKPSTMKVEFKGSCKPGVTAKDMILHLIARYGADGGSGCAIEFCGQAVRDLEVEARLTLCNMAVEFSAFTGLVAPDDKVFEYLYGREYAPQGEEWQRALLHWRELKSDPQAQYDNSLEVDCTEIEPTVTWGTSPQHAVAASGTVPDPRHCTEPAQRQGMEKAQAYMDLRPGAQMAEIKLDAAFIGSCTNSRLSDLRLAANYLRGRKIAPWVKAICVPGSMTVKRSAEAEGLDKVFKDAGFEWREAGCSMCFYAGGETFGAKKRVISSTNRNFEGRQGPGTRTHLASPLTVVASACKGYICSANEGE